jgi:hypothetical protein
LREKTDQASPQSLTLRRAPTTQAALAAIGQNIKDGKLVLNPALVSYLERKGTYKGEEDA